MKLIERGHIEDLWEIESPILKSTSFFKSTPNCSFVERRWPVSWPAASRTRLPLTQTRPMRCLWTWRMKELIYIWLWTWGGEGEQLQITKEITIAPGTSEELPTAAFLRASVFDLWHLQRAVKTAETQWPTLQDHCFPPWRPLLTTDMDCPQSFPLDCERQEIHKNTVKVVKKIHTCNNFQIENNILQSMTVMGRLFTRFAFKNCPPIPNVLQSPNL